MLEAQAAGGDTEAQFTLDSQPPLPEHAAHIWRAFLELNDTRGSTGYGPAPLSRQEIRNWERDELQPLEQWERRALLRIDAAYRHSNAPKSEAPEEE